MIEDKTYSKLTPSAKEELDNITEEFKEKIFEIAYTIAEERNTVNKEISLRDILEAQQASGQPLEKNKLFESKKYRLLSIFILSGIVYAVAGIFIYLFINNSFSLEKDLGLLITIIGILITLFAFLYSKILSKKQF